MKYFIYLVVILLFVALNLGVFPYLRLWQAEPNLLLLAVLVLALEKDDFDFFFWALVGGFFLDTYSGLFFGGFSLTFLLLGFALHLLVERVLMMELGVKSLLAITFFASLLSVGLVWFYNFSAAKLGVNTVSLDLNAVKVKILPQAFYNSLLVYPVYFFINVLKSKTEQFLSISKH